MRRVVLFLLMLIACSSSFAAHLKGGWIQYEYLGPGSAANTVKYRVTVRQYLDCNSSSSQIDADVSLGVFDNTTGGRVQALTIPLSGTDILDQSFFNACINPQPTVCFRVDRYITTIEVPKNQNGYTLSVQRCCRIDGIQNVSNSGSVGISYTTTIPGIINGKDFFSNNSPFFAQKDTVAVCYSSEFKFDFGATDADATDSLSYTFCEGFTGGSSGTPRPSPPSAPPYQVVPYASPFSGSSPLGFNVSIDPKTGLISGVAPSSTGDYVVTVCAYEYRDGELIGTTKKEIHITVANCQLSAAELKPNYASCDGFTWTFMNESAAAPTNYLWDVTYGTTNIFSSTAPTPTYTFADTGVYKVKLVVTASGGCTDTAITNLRVFPGFVPKFTTTGTCFQNPIQFKDQTFAQFGVVNGWTWDFGDLTTLKDTAHTKDTAWTYTVASTLDSITVRLISSSSKGCLDTVFQKIKIVDKPIISLNFKDTLVCTIDSIRLIATVSGGLAPTFAWSPVTPNMEGPNTSSPLIKLPQDTIRYVVTVNDQGCVNKDSLTINTLKFITVDFANDSTICRTDIIKLHPISQALSYVWTSSTPGEVVASVKNPSVQPTAVSTIYSVKANLGNCQDQDQVTIKTVPYPQAFASPDTAIICFGEKVQLNGSIVGSSFSWSPANSIINGNTLAPTAGPSKTTLYILTATDTLGCPKPISDTATIIVIQPIVVSAGNDTSIVANQPLQLNVISNGNIGTTYTWSPTTGLNNPDTSRPIATLSGNPDFIKYYIKAVSPEGCIGNDTIAVKVYKTAPQIFVPSAFTPNGDGKNDVLKPIPVGIVSIEYFSIFNRWGQQLFSTSEIGKGWDGNVNGTKQQSGTYVYIVQGKDFLGNTVTGKGTVVLIR